MRLRCSPEEVGGETGKCYSRSWIVLSKSFGWVALSVAILELLRPALRCLLSQISKRQHQLFLQRSQCRWRLEGIIQPFVQIAIHE